VDEWWFLYKDRVVNADSGGGASKKRKKSADIDDAVDEDGNKTSSKTPPLCRCDQVIIIP
jgi:predicted GNAT superfamily acetyltransferase